MDREQLKEDCINLYLQGKNYSEIARLKGYSRTYITNLIKDDERIKNMKNTKIIKVYKRKDDKRLQITIPAKFIKNLGISSELKSAQFVEISMNEKKNEIIIKKHSQ